MLTTELTILVQTLRAIIYVACYKSDKIMLQLLKYLIFGKQCQHQWEHDRGMKPFSNKEKHIYICQKCGKIKTVKMYVTYHGE